MSKLRVVNTRFWDDDYTSNLDPIEKLLFLYFLTNTSTDICGVYEIPLKKVAIDTGIERETVQKILDRFERDGKIYYQEGWVGVKNFIKHQSLNPRVVDGIKIGLVKAPKGIVDRLSIDFDSSSHLNLNTKRNSNTKSNTKGICLFFDEFWAIYPNKENKKGAREKWMAKNLDSKWIEIKNFIERAKGTSRWQSGFVPHPTTFMNQERWTDDLASYDQKQKRQTLEVIKL